MPLTVMSSRIFCPASLPPLAATFLKCSHHAVDHAVFQLVVAMRRHGRRLPGARQLVLQLGESLAGVAVEHVEHGERRHQAVVIAAAERRIEEEMARLLEADQRAGLVAVALDVGMAGLPELGRGAVLLQHRIGEEQPGRFHVGDEQRARLRAAMSRASITPTLSAKIASPSLSTTPQRSPSPSKARPRSAPVLEHGVARRVQHVEIFGIGIVRGEGVVELAIERDDGGAKLGENARREGAGRAVAAGDDDLQRAQQFRPRQKVGHVALGHVGHEDVAAAFVLLGEVRVEHDLLERGHVVGREGEGPLDAHLDAGPAIVVMAGGDHGDAFDFERELREIGHGRERQADVVHLGAAGEQSCGQRRFHRGRIGAVVMADDDAQRHAALRASAWRAPSPTASSPSRLISSG